MSLGGICLGLATNNIVEYHAVTGLLTKTIASDVIHIRVYLDSELVFHWLNQVYTISNPLLIRTFQIFCLLKMSFEHVSYHHILIHLNTIVDSLENYVLDWYLAHI